MSSRLSTPMQIDLMNTNVYSGGYLVVITFNNESSIRLSNTSQTLTDDDDPLNTIFYEDRGLKISSIRESIDFKDHRYKISNTTIEVSNLLKDGVRFSDLIDSDVNEIVNSRIEIYYKTQGVKSLDSCLKVYYGVATKCTMDSSKVSIQVEDDSTSLFQNSTLPKAKQSNNLILNDSFSESTIPMCFGEVDKAPLAPQKLRKDSSDLALLPDDIYNFNIIGNMNRLFALVGNTYFEIPDTSKIHDELLVDTGGETQEDFQKFDNNLQWFSDGGTKFITIPRDYQDSEYSFQNNLNHFNPLNLAAKGYLQVRNIRTSNSDPILSENEVNIQGGDGGIIKYVGDRYQFDKSGELFTFPQEDGVTTYEGLVWNWGLRGILDDPSDVESAYAGGNGRTMAWLCQQEENNSFVTDNGLELVYTPFTMPTGNGKLEQAWQDYLRFLLTNFYPSEMANVSVYLTNNDIDLQVSQPQTYEFESPTERVSRYFVEELLWPAGRVAVNKINASSTICYFSPSELSNPAEPYCWGWSVDKDEIASQYDNGNYVNEDAGLNLRFLKMWMPTSVDINTGELTNYQCVADGRGSNDTLESQDDQQETLENFRNLYWSNTIGIKVNERGTRVGGLLPSVKLDPILTPEEYDDEFGHFEIYNSNSINNNLPDVSLGEELYMVTNVFHSFGRPATEADGSVFDALEGEQGWYNQGNVYPGRFHWPTTDWGTYFSEFIGRNEFSFYMEYGGKKGIYTNMAGYFDPSLPAFSDLEEEIILINTISDKSTHPQTEQLLHFGTPRNGWSDKIEIMHSEQEVYTNAETGVEDYSERYRIIFPLQNVSTTNIVKGSAETFIVCKVDCDLQMKSLLDPGNTTKFDIKTMLVNQDGANEILFQTQTSSNQYVDFTISSEPGNQFIEYSQDGGHTTEIPGSMIIKDSEWTDLDNRTDIIFDVGMRGTGASAGLAKFNLTLQSPHVYQTALLGSIEEAKFFGFVQGRSDDEAGKYTGTPSNLITKPSDIIYNIISEEMGYGQTPPAGITESRGNHSEMNYSFSIQKEIDFKKFIDDFSIETKLIPKFRISDGAFKFVNKTDAPQGEQGQYDWVLDDADIIKQSFAKTPVKDIILKCRVLFDYDYGLKKYLSSTDEPGYGAVPDNYDEYIQYYNVQNVEPHYLELEAKHIRDMATAKHLRNHILEYRKNTYLEMTLDLPVKYLFVEAGDTFIYRNLDEDNNPVYRGNFKPYGIDYMNMSSLLGQMISPHWVVKSVVKKQDGVTIKANQFHFLNPGNVTEQSPDYNTDLISDGVSDSVDLETSTIILGDINQDGLVDVLDIVGMINVILGNAEPEELEVIISDE